MTINDDIRAAARAANERAERIVSLLLLRWRASLHGEPAVAYHGETYDTLGLSDRTGQVMVRLSDFSDEEIAEHAKRYRPGVHSA